MENLQKSSVLVGRDIPKNVLDNNHNCDQTTKPVIITVAVIVTPTKHFQAQDSSISPASKRMSQRETRPEITKPAKTIMKVMLGPASVTSVPLSESMYSITARCSKLNVRIRMFGLKIDIANAVVTARLVPTNQKRFPRNRLLIWSSGENSKFPWPRQHILDLGNICGPNLTNANG